MKWQAMSRNLMVDGYSALLLLLAVLFRLLWKLATLVLPLHLLSATDSNKPPATGNAKIIVTYLMHFSLVFVSGTAPNLLLCLLSGLYKILCNYNADVSLDYLIHVPDYQWCASRFSPWTISSFPFIRFLVIIRMQDSCTVQSSCTTV